MNDKKLEFTAATIYNIPKIGTIKVSIIRYGARGYLEDYYVIPEDKTKLDELVLYMKEKRVCVQYKQEDRLIVSPSVSVERFCNKLIE